MDAGTVLIVVVLVAAVGWFVWARNSAKRQPPATEQVAAPPLEEGAAGAPTGAAQGTEALAGAAPAAGGRRGRPGKRGRK